MDILLLARLKVFLLLEKVLFYSFFCFCYFINYFFLIFSFFIFFIFLLLSWFIVSAFGIGKNHM